MAAQTNLMAFREKRGGFHAKYDNLIIMRNAKAKRIPSFAPNNEKFSGGITSCPASGQWWSWVVQFVVACPRRELYSEALLVAAHKSAKPMSL